MPTSRNHGLYPDRCNSGNADVACQSFAKNRGSLRTDIPRPQVDPDPREVLSRLVEFLASERPIVGESEALVVGVRSPVYSLDVIQCYHLCFATFRPCEVSGPYKTRYLHGLTSSGRQRLITANRVNVLSLVRDICHGPRLWLFWLSGLVWGQV